MVFGQVSAALSAALFVLMHMTLMNILAHRLGRLMDVDLMAVLLMAGGVLGMSGALVSPELSEQSWLLVRTLALGGLMVVVGMGLLSRHDWARRFLAGALMYAIYAQLSRRWMQSDVVQAWLSCVQGNSLHAPVAAGNLPPLSPEGALLSLLVCVALGGLTRLLLSARMRVAFAGSGHSGHDSGHVPPGSGSEPEKLRRTTTTATAREWR
jgi:uncharacterized membrane protein SirB2